MSYAPDPGGQFASDVHRRVLGHLSTPYEDVGWELVPLTARLAEDVGTPDLSADEISVVLDDLSADGHVVLHDGGVWQQSPDGADLLNGPIANEPPPGASVTGPAAIGKLSPQPTKIGSE